jgi:hypothetical protein
MTSTFFRQGPAHSLLLTNVIRSGGMIEDRAQEHLATEFPKVAFELAAGGTARSGEPCTSVKLKDIYSILAGWPEASDLRHGTVATPALTRLKETVARLFSNPPGYIEKGQPVPITLPWVVARGGGRGNPYMLRREIPEVVEWLLQAELDHRAAEEELRRVVQTPGWRPRPLPWLQRSPDEPPPVSVYTLLGIEEPLE